MRWAEGKHQRGRQLCIHLCSGKGVRGAMGSPRNSVRGRTGAQSPRGGEMGVHEMAGLSRLAHR